MTDSNETEQLVAAVYHAERSKAKKRKAAAKDRGSGVMHHRNATDWWKFVGR